MHDPQWLKRSDYLFFIMLFLYPTRKIDPHQLPHGLSGLYL